MWKIMHALFGYDYIVAISSYSQKICRLKTAPNGRKYVCPYSHSLYFIDAPLPNDGRSITGECIR